jgi:hypothetical protein
MTNALVGVIKTAIGRVPVATRSWNFAPPFRPAGWPRTGIACRAPGCAIRGHSQGVSDREAVERGKLA